MSSTHVKQVGGDHYEAPLQHWDFIEAHGIGYLEGNATKYLCRWRKKGTPVLDLEKAVTYAEKTKALHLEGSRYQRGTCSLQEAHAYALGLGMDEQETCAFGQLCCWKTADDLDGALMYLGNLLGRARQEAARG